MSRVLLSTNALIDSSTLWPGIRSFHCRSSLSEPRAKCIEDPAPGYTTTGAPTDNIRYEWRFPLKSPARSTAESVGHYCGRLARHVGLALPPVENGRVAYIFACRYIQIYACAAASLLLSCFLSVSFRIFLDPLQWTDNRKHKRAYATSAGGG